MRARPAKLCFRKSLGKVSGIEGLSWRMILFSERKVLNHRTTPPAVTKATKPAHKSQSICSFEPASYASIPNKAKKIMTSPISSMIMNGVEVAGPLAARVPMKANTTTKIPNRSINRGFWNAANIVPS